MDTKWMNGKLIVPAAMIMSLGLIGCSSESEEADATDAAAVVESAADDAATNTDAATEAVEEAADDAADAVEEAAETADDGG